MEPRPLRNFNLRTCKWTQPLATLRFLLGVASSSPDCWVTSEVNAASDDDSLVYDFVEQETRKATNEHAASGFVDDRECITTLLDGRDCGVKRLLERLSQSLAMFFVPRTSFDQFCCRLRREPNSLCPPFMRR